MNEIRTAILFIALGLLTNVTIAVWLSATVDFNKTPAVIPPLSFQTSGVASPFDSLSIECVHGLGTQRRAWQYADLSSTLPASTLGYPDLLSQMPNTPRLMRGPFFSIALGGEDSWGLLYTFDPNETDMRSFSGAESAAGFPAVSFWHEIQTGSTGNYITPGAIRLEPKQATSIRRVRAIPYRPIWPGLIFNTIFYALLAFITHRLVRIIREHRRFTKGRCPKCKYDLNANLAPGCPECGWRRSTTQPPAHA